MKGSRNSKKPYIDTLLLEEKAGYEQQVAVAQWIQAFGVFYEAILLSKLYSFTEESGGDTKIIIGIWVQTLGQLVEASAVSAQLTALSESALLKAQQFAVSGDLLQSVGAGLQAIGGEEILAADGIGNVSPEIIP